MSDGMSRDSMSAFLANAIVDPEKLSDAFLSSPAKRANGWKSPSFFVPDEKNRSVDSHQKRSLLLPGSQNA